MKSTSSQTEQLVSQTCTAEEIQTHSQAILRELERVILGKKGILQLILTCLLAEGHLLLEDVPGTGKTVAAKALALALGGRFQRVQGTPDLLPGDVTGSSIYNPKTGEFSFQPGPVFSNILLADELNRATPRAQSALLECMAERQVSVEGKTYKLQAPFFVLGTQNPIDQEGTFPLPEAQLDRFMMKLSMGYPGLEAETRMLGEQQRSHPLSEVQQVSSPEQVSSLQAGVRAIYVAAEVQQYIVRLVDGTRHSESLALGAGPRASIGLMRCAQAWAALQGRAYVLPDDIRRMVPSVLHHRVMLSPEGRLQGSQTGQIVEQLMRKVPAPSDLKARPS